MPNTLAYLVLYSWPLVTLVLFRRLKLHEAIIATILLGYLFIPERVGFKIPMLPEISKDSLPSICAIIATIFYRRNEERQRRIQARRQPSGEEGAAEGIWSGRQRVVAVPRTGSSRVDRVSLLLVGVLLIAPIITWLTNTEVFVAGPIYLPGVTAYDVGSMTLGILVMLFAFLLARRELGAPEAQLAMLKIFAYCTLVYTPLVVWEARMSPQINMRMYGFFAHDWFQHIRDGHFRPIVFLEHGLRVGIFLAMGTIAMGVLFRIDAGGNRLRWLLATLWTIACLVVSRNLGAMAIAVALLAVVVLLPLRLQFWLAAVVALIVLVYPIARGNGLVPTQAIYEFVDARNQERAQSLDFRFYHEDALLAKANQKPLAGWGPWGRSRVYDPETGEDVSVTDGSWVLIIGIYGWIGYLGQFGLMCLPIVFMAMRQKRLGLTAVDAGVVLMVCANLIDLIPNSSNVSILWMASGAIWARIAHASQQMRNTRISRYGDTRSRAADRREEPQAAVLQGGPRAA